MPPATRPRAVIWTPERVEHWQRTGQVPSKVMVWTPGQTGGFLDHAVHDRLYPLFHLIAHRGLRRGEACGLRWVETGLVFTEPDGSPLHPADVTEHFQHLTRQAGLPPIRLHDLRHGAATLALAAGVEMKVVQAMLRHYSITVTSDLYTDVLPEVARAAAEKTLLIIPRASTCRLGRGSGTVETTVDSRSDQENSSETTKPQVSSNANLGSCSTPPGTRTPNPLVKSERFCVSGDDE